MHTFALHNYITKHGQKHNVKILSFSVASIGFIFWSGIPQNSETINSWFLSMPSKAFMKSISNNLPIGIFHHLLHQIYLVKGTSVSTKSQKCIIIPTLRQILPTFWKQYIIASLFRVQHSSFPLILRHNLPPI